MNQNDFIKDTNEHDNVLKNSALEMNHRILGKTNPVDDLLVQNVLNSNEINQNKNVELKNEHNHLDNENEPEEKDTLDEFMENLNLSLLNESQEMNNKINKKNEVFFDDNDHTADFLEMKTKQALEPKPSNRFEDLSDTEDDGYSSDKKTGTPKNQLLLPIVHSSIAYKPFKKDIYVEHEDVKQRSIEESVKLRESQKISVSGYKVPTVVGSFHELSSSLDRCLLKSIKKMDWDTPTPIQAQLIPAILAGRNVIATSETGSGKTAAYAIPSIQRVFKVLDEWILVKVPPHLSPLILVLLPTRELALQVYSVFKKLAHNLNIRISCFAGGFDKTQQFKEIRQGFEICIANPGRLIDLCLMKGGMSLSSVTMLILDEADKMLELGFQDEVNSIVASLRPDCITIMISATLNKAVESFVLSLVRSPIRVTVGEINQSAENVEERHLVFTSEQHKVEWLLRNIDKFIKTGYQIIIFCKSYGRTNDVASIINDHLSELMIDTGSSYPKISNPRDLITDDLISDNRLNDDSLLNPILLRLSHNIPEASASSTNIDDDTNYFDPSNINTTMNNSNNTTVSANPNKIYCRTLYGTMNQAERLETISGFTKKRFSILVASDLASRGLNIPNVAYVINYDAAKSIETHIHRIGRTGRYKSSGVAFTLLTKADNRLAGFFVESLETSQREVSKSLLKLAMSCDQFRKARQQGYSYTVQMTKKKDKNVHKNSTTFSTGLGYNSQTKPLPSPEKSSKSYPYSSNTSESTYRCGRWDSAKSSNKNSYEEKKYVNQTNQNSNSSSESNFKRKMNNQSQENAANAENIMKKPKIYNPQDDVSSDSDDSDTRDGPYQNFNSAINNEMYSNCNISMDTKVIPKSKSRWDVQ